MPNLPAVMEPIPLSAVQHAVYCLRQAALIHLERLWAENRFTAEGDVLHAVADKGGARRARGVRRVMSLPLASARLNLTGVADLVEFIPGPEGERAFPVEYKRGKPKRYAWAILTPAIGPILRKILAYGPQPAVLPLAHRL